MTDPVKVLSDDELNYLESRSQDTSLDYAEVDEVLRRVPALCATVRALRAELTSLQVHVEERDSLLDSQAGADEIAKLDQVLAEAAAVREIRDEWAAGQADVFAAAANEIAERLKSLTLEQGEQEKHK